jgi:hypothetical protein
VNRLHGVERQVHDHLAKTAFVPGDGGNGDQASLQLDRAAIGVCLQQIQHSGRQRNELHRLGGQFSRAGELQKVLQDVIESPDLVFHQAEWFQAWSAEVLRQPFQSALEDRELEPGGVEGISNLVG